MKDKIVVKKWVNLSNMLYLSKVNIQLDNILSSTEVLPGFTFEIVTKKALKKIANPYTDRERHEEP